MLSYQIRYKDVKCTKSEIFTPYDSQEKEGFDVEGFSAKHKLLKFSFVRHPYER